MRVCVLSHLETESIYQLTRISEAVAHAHIDPLDIEVGSCLLEA